MTRRELAVEHLRLVRDQYLEHPLAKTYVEDAIVQLSEGGFNRDDRGAMTVGMVAREGKVILTFGMAIEWLGLGPDQAVTVAQALTAHAAIARAQVEQQRSSNGEATRSRRSDAQEADGQGAAAQDTHPEQDPVVDPRD